MNPKLTEIICIVDKSGSMESIRSDAAGAFNAFIRDQKKVKGDAKLTLILFNHNYWMVTNAGSLDAIPALNEATYIPEGNTALNDAIGKTLINVGERLSNTPEDQRPSKVIVVILTDGKENHSHLYSTSQIKEMIKHQQEKYSWDFIYLSASPDAFADAKAYGIHEHLTANFAHDAAGIRSAYASISCAVEQGRTTGHTSFKADDKNP